MSYGITRINGTTQAGGFYGLQPVILKIAGTGVGAAGINGNFEKAIRAIQLRASIVYIGTRANDQFVVIIDGTSANAYNGSNSDTDITVAIDTVVTAATSVSTTVTDITGLTAGSLA
jgi:hypothetical protein